MLFGGFFIGSDAIPDFLSWLRYLSFLNYGFAAIMQNEFKNRFITDCALAPEDAVCVPCLGPRLPSKREPGVCFASVGIRVRWLRCHLRL